MRRNRSGREWQGVISTAEWLLDTLDRTVQKSDWY